MTQYEQKRYNDFKKLFQYLQTDHGKMLLLNDDFIRMQTAGLQRELTGLDNYSELSSITVCRMLTLLNILEEKINCQTDKPTPKDAMQSAIKDLYPFLFSQLQELDWKLPYLIPKLISILCDERENTDNPLHALKGSPCSSSNQVTTSRENKKTKKLADENILLWYSYALGNGIETDWNN